MLANCASAALVAIVTCVSARRIDGMAAADQLFLSASSATRWHATLCGAAVAGLLSFGVRALRPREGRTGQAETMAHSQLVRHALLNGAAAAQTLAGVGLAWLAARSEPPHRHVTSWHGCIGMAASLALLWQLAVGLFLRYCLPEASKRRLAVEFLHAMGGGATFGLASVALGSGLFTDWFLRRCPPSLLLAGLICLYLIGLRVFAQIWEHYF
ncbi:hypothetical protein BOX15_Mlig031995g3 [Macrostomum lignano]|uniref:ascorbate ferrireductase (transmembrane) n=2 Tax=Macrostomum lignano TaxID=282301 RepID=A0A1I8G3Y1_9PLAT|nr:hypothetical protein BOX15_Mlig031995g3 [Macrostomum lignano]